MIGKVQIKFKLKVKMATKFAQNPFVELTMNRGIFRFARVQAVLLGLAIYMISLPANLWAYKDTIRAAPTGDTIREAVQIDISSDQIRLKYDDGTDSIIQRNRGTNQGHGNRLRQDAIIAVGKNEVIATDDSARSDVMVVFGNLRIDGYVKGNISVVFGDIMLTTTGSVEGKITCVGKVTLDSGTHIWGDIKALDLITPENDKMYDFKGSFSRMKFNLADVKWFGPPAALVTAGFLAVVLVIILALTTILPKPVARVRYQVEGGFIRCFLLGVLLTIAIFPLWVLILITIIGIPIALLIYPFIVIGAYVLGAIGVTQYAGFELGRRTTMKYEGYLRTTLAGALLIGSPLILATFFGFINIRFMAWALHLTHLAVQFVLFTTGLGAIFFSRFGSRPLEIELNPGSQPLDSPQ